MASITKLCTSAFLQTRITALVGKNVPRQAMCTIIQEGDHMKVKHKPTDFERKMLVWTKKYKSVNEVPEFVNLEAVQRARNKFQIKISNWLMVLSGAACIYLVYNGKHARDRGDSITNSNLQWHKEYNETTKRTGTDYATHFDKIASAGLAAEEKAASVVPKNK